MNKDIFSTNIYPYNLLSAIKGRTSLELPPHLTPDICAGIQYALSTLEREEQQLLQLHYEKQYSLADTAAALSIPVKQADALHASAFKKLRASYRWNYIRHGILGWQKKEKTRVYNQGYQKGYATGIADRTNGISPSLLENGIHDKPIIFLNLSPRAYNCLDRAGYATIGQVAEIDREKILSMRGLGKRSMDEIARALKHLKVPCTPWYEFIL